MRKVVWVFFWLLLTACANDGVAYARHESEALGIAFEYPKAWALASNELEVNVATDEALFAASAANFRGGAVVNFSPLPVEIIDGDLAGALQQFTSFVAANEEAEPVVEVAMLTVNGRSAAQAQVGLTESMQMVVTMVQGETQVILVAAVYDEAQYETMIRHMVESITFMP